MRERDWNTFGVQADTLIKIPDWVKKASNPKITYLKDSNLSNVIIERDENCIFIKNKDNKLVDDRWYDLYVIYDTNCGYITLNDYKTTINGITYKALIKLHNKTYYYSNKLAIDNVEEFLCGYADYYSYYVVLESGNYSPIKLSEFLDKTDFKKWLIQEFENDMKTIGESGVEKRYELVEVPVNA